MAAMVHVVHLLHTFPPQTRGGIENHVEALAGDQQSAGGRVHVVCGTTEGRAVGWQRHTELDVLRLPSETEWTRAQHGGRSAALEAFGDTLRTLRPDIVHVHHFGATGPGPVAVAAALGIPTVVTLHDLYGFCPLHFRLRDQRDLCAPDVGADTCVVCLSQASGMAAGALAPMFTARTAAFESEFRRAGRILAPSNALVEYLAAVPLLAARRRDRAPDPAVECVGFPSAATAPPTAPRARAASVPSVPSAARAASGPLHIATWGGLVPGKGLHVLIEAAGLLGRGAVELAHHGGILDTGYAERCAARARELAVPLVIAGPFEPAELAARVADADVAVFPSLFLETYGLTTDEALALGLAVVVPDRGAPKERIGTRGRVFRTGDAADLARVLAPFVAARDAVIELERGEASTLLDLASYRLRLAAIYAQLIAAGP